MTPNSFGELFRITSFGESHGEALGVVIEGVPANLVVSTVILDDMMSRRRPGQSPAVSGRAEPDKVEFLSGIFEGKTLGTPIAAIVRNLDARSEDYDEIKVNPRPGHADQAWKDKFGHVDHRGGGRSSGRETLARVIGGAFARMLMEARYPNIKVKSLPRQIGPLSYPEEFQDFLKSAKLEGQSYGGVGEVTVANLPKGLGEPVFMKLKAELAKAAMSLGATMGFEIGDGFSVANVKGTDLKSSGGQSGGISNGEDLTFRVAFKPTSSVLDVAKKGRHDPCIVPRALVVLEAMTWLTLANLDQWRRLGNMETN